MAAALSAFRPCPSNCCPIAALTKAEADSAYTQGRYQQAVKAYEQLLKQGVSADLYYNLGNAYYRTDDITRAVLNYERALLLSPGDADIRFNLQMARSKTIDKITPESEMFFVTWYRSLVNTMSVDGWARTGARSSGPGHRAGPALSLCRCRLAAQGGLLRRLCCCCSSCRQPLCLRPEARADPSSAELSSWHRRPPSRVHLPSNGTDLFILHEGTRVDIIDDQMQQWKQIRVADGKEGWIETSQIETI